MCDDIKLEKVKVELRRLKSKIIEQKQEILDQHKTISTYRANEDARLLGEMGFCEAGVCKYSARIIWKKWAGAKSHFWCMGHAKEFFLHWSQEDIAKGKLVDV